MWNIALGLMERMTDRERLRTMGGYLVSIKRNYPQAIDTYRQLVSLYPADSVGHGNLAVAYFYTLDFPKALEEGRRGIEIHPRSLKFRSNYALYAMYASDFSSGAATARELLNEDATLDSPYLPLAADAVARGDLASARSIYEEAVSTGAAGAASLGSLGLSDLAMYEGRHDAAAQTLLSGADHRKAENVMAEAAKLVALAQAHAAAGRASDAQRAAAQALALGDDDSIRVPVGRFYIAQKRGADARKMIEQLSSASDTEPAYATLLESDVALEGGDIAGGSRCSIARERWPTSGWCATVSALPTCRPAITSARCASSTSVRSAAVRPARCFSTTSQASAISRTCPTGTRARSRRWASTTLRGPTTSSSSPCVARESRIHWCRMRERASRS